ncbi:S8 family serine peptidase [Escherichia coli]
MPDMETEKYFKFELDDTPQPIDAYEDLPIIGIIDSGLNNHPFLDNVIVGTVSYLNDAGQDSWGHGTSVAGVAVFGDLRHQLAQNQLIRYARICSAKVVDDKGRFPDDVVIPKLMSQAIRQLHHNFNCRIFNISLGDPKAPFKGDRNGQWASILDDLARDLDILIIVSAGNGSSWGQNQRMQFLNIQTI